MDLVVKTTAGAIQGREKDGVLLFAGVPYAAPPIGRRRFAPPEAHEGWEGTRDATRFGKVAPQKVGMTEALTGAKDPDWSEDCLTLNVQTAALDDRRRPVMLWVHGGGFVSGRGSVPWYNGARFARRGIVAVSINYRLGAFGWLHLAHLDPSLASSGNAGLQDQIAALRWVKDNIAAFGGDPGNVTIFGESAGGMSVATLLGTPEAQGLFHKVIAQSGAAHHVHSAAEAQDVADAVLAEAGVGGDVDALRKVPAPDLLAAQAAVATKFTLRRAAGPAATGLGLPFCPVVDGQVLPEPPLDAISRGVGADVALLTGSNRDEWNLFALTATTPLDEDDVMRRLAKLVPQPAEVADLYAKAVESGDYDAVWRAVMTDRVFAIPATRLAEAHAAQGGAGTYLYVFEWASPAFGGKLGSCHALEVPFVFDNLAQPGVSVFAGANPPQKLADVMHKAWVAFARTGDPNHEGLPTWPAYAADRRSTMHFGAECRVDDDPRSSIRQVWEGII